MSSCLVWFGPDFRWWLQNVEIMSRLLRSQGLLGELYGGQIQCPLDDSFSGSPVVETCHACSPTGSRLA